MTPVTSHQQRDEALALANAKRSARHELRRRMNTGDVDWQAVILDPPECVHGMLLCELVFLVPRVHRHAVEVLGDEALRDGVSLLMRCERASTRTRQWIVTHLVPATPGRPGIPRGRRRGPRRRVEVLAA